MTEKPNDINLFSEAIILAFIPALGYGVSFWYEFGFFGYFNLPEAQLTVTIASTIRAVCVVVSFLISTLLVANFSKDLFRYLDQSASGRFLRSMIFPLTLGLIPVLTGDGTGTLAIACVLFLLAFGFSFLTNIGKGSIEEKLLNQEWKENGAGTWTDDLWTTLGSRRVVFFLVLPLLLLYTSYYLGRREARNLEYFLVPVNQPDWVVLRSYDDRYIMGQIEPTSKTLSPCFTFQSLGDADPKDAVRFNYKKVGPLRPSEKDD